MSPYNSCLNVITWFYSSACDALQHLPSTLTQETRQQQQFTQRKQQVGDIELEKHQYTQG